MTLFRCLKSYIGDPIFTTLRRTETFHMTDKYTHTETQKSPRAHGLTSFSRKTRKSNHLQMLEKRQHLLLNYFKTLSVGPAGNRTQASRTIDKIIYVIFFGLYYFHSNGLA